MMSYTHMASLFSIDIHSFTFEPSICVICPYSQANFAYQACCIPTNLRLVYADGSFGPSICHYKIVFVLNAFCVRPAKLGMVFITFDSLPLV